MGGSMKQAGIDSPPDVGRIIHKEHLDLFSVLTCLRIMVRKGKENSQPINTLAIYQAFTYIENVLNTYHHPKEEAYLFPVLRTRCPELGDVLDELETQHRELPQYLAKVTAALSLYEAAPDEQCDTFCDAVEEWCSREINHMRLEESKILSPARKILTDDDWAAIDTAFGENPDPLFGDEKNAAYNELFRELLNDMPAPFGYGDPD